MAYATMSTQVTGYVVLASDWNEIVNNFPQTAPGLVGADGEIVVATAANALKKLAAMTGDLFLHELGALEADVSAYDGFPLIDGGTTANWKMSFTETDAPDANDDTTDGWKVGSIWADVTNDNIYMCVDITDTAAVWLLLGGTGARIATGSYTGDGETSQAITGIGFQVKWVYISERRVADGAAAISQVIMASDVIVDDHASGLAITNYTQTNWIEDRIIALGADGFTVDDGGSDQDPNQDTVTYNFLCIG